MKNGLIPAFLSILFLFTCAHGNDSDRVTLTFTGDIMMHYAVKGCALVHSENNNGTYSVDGFRYLFQKIAPALSLSDYTMGNMEFPVSPPFIQDEFIFNCPREVIPALKESGFDAVSLANNHIFDQGNKGVLNTMGFLEEAQLPYLGAARKEIQARDGIVFTKNGISVGIISYTGLINYKLPDKISFFVNDLNDRRRLFADIASLKKRCDFVIVQPHSGVEYTLVPTADQRKLYREIIEAGADIVIGHHPHTLQYAEEITVKDGRRAAIFYSLGNFICNQTYSYPIPQSNDRLDIRASGIVSLTISRVDGKLMYHAFVDPIYTVHEMRKYRGKQYKDIQVISLYDEINNLRAEAAAKSPAEAGIILKRIAFLTKQVTTIKKVLFAKPDYKLISFHETNIPENDSAKTAGADKN